MAEDKTGLCMLGIVGIVAGLAVFTGLLGMNLEQQSVTAAAVTDVQITTASHAEWTSCLDQGNLIILHNEEDRMLKKKDLCTGSNTEGKLIARVSCTQDIDGDFTYMYQEAQACPAGLNCLKDDDGTAYCG